MSIAAQLILAVEATVTEATSASVGGGYERLILYLIGAQLGLMLGLLGIVITLVRWLNTRAERRRAEDREEAQRQRTEDKEEAQRQRTEDREAAQRQRTEDKEHHQQDFQRLERKADAHDMKLSDLQKDVTEIKVAVARLAGDQEGRDKERQLQATPPVPPTTAEPSEATPSPEAEQPANASPSEVDTSAEAEQPPAAGRPPEGDEPTAQASVQPALADRTHRV